MNRIYCVFALLFLASFARADSQAEFVTFTNALWGSFSLAPPTNVQSCFNASTSNYFFQFLEAAYAITEDTLAGNLSNYMLYDFTNEQAMGQQINPSFACSFATSDFQNLVNELNIGGYSSFSNASALYWAIYQFVNAFPQVVNKDLSSVISNIESGSYAQAGTQMSGFLKDISFNGENDLDAFAIISFFNGIFLGTDLGFPYGFANCFSTYNSSQLVPLNQFYRGQFSAMYGIKSIETYPVLYAYYNGKGEGYYNNVPSSLWTCLNSTYEAKQLANTFNFTLDPYDQCFVKSMYHFINSDFDSKIEYQDINAKIYSAMLPDFFDAAALTYKQLLLDISSKAPCVSI